jgi:hypothetical protein
VGFPAYGCAYDGNGNLFVDGNREPNKHSQIGFKLGELPRGQTKFRTFSVGSGYDFWGQVQWDGKYVDVSAYEYILRFAIHGRKAVAVGSLNLHDLKYINGYWIQGSKVIATNRFGMSQYPLALIYRYPKGGKPIRTIAGQPGSGVTVSVAPSSNRVTR